jgi:hypothetical protein
MAMPCPTCNTSQTPAAPAPFLPFCSERCQAIDMSKWLNEDYVINQPLTADVKGPSLTPDSIGVTDDKLDPTSAAASASRDSEPHDGIRRIH